MATAPAARNNLSVALVSPVARRVAIVVIALILALAVIQQGVAAILLDRAPALSAQIDGNAKALTEAARAAIEAGGKPDDDATAALISRALARDLTNPTTIEFRALQIAPRDHARALRLFTLSSAISRRSLPTRLWLIEEAVQREDIVGALDNFDIALRTSTAAPPALFPILAAASTDPVLAPAIARILDRKPAWERAFLYDAITRAKVSDGIAAVLLSMRERGPVRAFALDQTLIGQLIADGRFATARRVYASYNGASFLPALLADPHFDQAGQRFPFGWSLIDRGEFGAQRGSADGRAVLAYQAVGGAGGNVASQLLMLAPGAYRLAAATAEAASDPAAPPVWTLTCAQRGGGQIALLVQPATKGARAATDFAVPADCTAQWLALTLRPSASDDGQSGSVAAISVVSMNRPSAPMPQGRVRMPLPTRR